MIFYPVQYLKEKRLKSVAAFSNVSANLHFRWPYKLQSSLERLLGNIREKLILFYLKIKIFYPLYA